MQKTKPLDAIKISNRQVGFNRADATIERLLALPTTKYRFAVCWTFTWTSETQRSLSLIFAAHNAVWESAALILLTFTIFSWLGPLGLIKTFGRTLPASTPQRELFYAVFEKHKVYLQKTGDENLITSDPSWVLQRITSHEANETK